MKRKKIILIVLLVMALLVACYLVNLYNKPHINVAETTPKIELMAKTLLDDFQNDENVANLNYLGQIIQVKGTITSIENGTVTLGNSDSFGSIICNLSLEESKHILDLKEGQNISIKGICTGYLMDVILINSVIVKQ